MWQITALVPITLIFQLGVLNEVNAQCPVGNSSFVCPDGSCHPASYVCDVIVDCSDRADEHGCFPDPGFSCEPDNFTCTDGSCIRQEWRCDGVNDCGDNSDEQLCVAFGVDVNCGDDGSNIQITVSGVPDLSEWAGNEQAWQLNNVNDPACQPTFNTTTGTATYASFRGSVCDTGPVETTPDYFIYRFLISPTPEGNTPVRMYDHSHTITCQYNRDGTVQDSFEPIHNLEGSSEETQNLQFHLAMYSNPERDSAFGGSINLGTTIYARVNVTQQFVEDLDLLMELCFTSTNQAGTDKVYNLIQNSCDLNNLGNVNYNCQDHTDELEDFEFEAYRYPNQDDNDEVWLHCNVIACLSSNPISQCRTRCESCGADRKRRDTVPFTDGTRFQLASGPYRFVDSDPSEEQKDQPATPAELILILSASCGVVATAIVSVIILAVLRKRRHNSSVTETAASEEALENPGCETRDINKNI